MTLIIGAPDKTALIAMEMQVMETIAIVLVKDTYANVRWMTFIKLASSETNATITMVGTATANGQMAKKTGARTDQLYFIS